MTATARIAGCPLCEDAGGKLIYQGDKFRVIRAAELGFPAFYRLVWRDHVTEFSDLAREDRIRCIDAVTVIEQCLREALAPTKVNLATLGNVVPHLHWHVIARFGWDSHFPGPVWTAAQRERALDREAALTEKLAPMERTMVERLGAGGF